MAIAITGNGATSYTAVRTSITLTIPGGAGSGDLMIAVCYESENTSAGTWDDDGGGGNDWIQLHYARSTQGRDRETAIYWKFHDGSESNPTFTHGLSEPMNGMIFTFSGVDTVTPFEWKFLAGNDTINPTNTAIGCAADNSLALVVQCATHDDIDTTGVPSGYTLRAEVTVSRSGTDFDHTDQFGATKSGISAGTETPGAWTHSGTPTTTAEYHCYTFAIMEVQNVRVTDFNTTEEFTWGATGLVVTGTGFEASQGSGKVEFWSDLSGTIKTVQTIDTWSATSITIDTVQGSLGDKTTVYMVVTNDSAEKSAAFACDVGFLEYVEIIGKLKPDHYWKLDNSYTDTGNTGPQLDMGTSDHASDYGAFTASGTVIAEDSDYAWKVDAVTEAREIADSPNMNVTISSQERTVAGWIQLGGVQQSLGCVWKEGGQIQNLAFVVGIGNVLLAQLADTAGTRDNVQAVADVRLTPNRPYHICMRYTHLETTKEFLLFLDGEEQTVTDGNPMTLGIFDTHSGNVVWADPDNNLETGTTDISYAGQEDCTYSHWVTWSDNSQGGSAGALDPTTEIRDKLFRRGALSKYTISTDTEANMQADLNTQLSGSEVEDWPLGIRIEAPTGDGDLELIASGITFDSRTTAQLEWRGTGTLTWVLEDGSELDSDKIFSPLRGNVTIINAPAVTITVKNASDASVVSGARVRIRAASGGDMPFEESITIVRSGSTATVTHTAHGMRTGLKIFIKGATQKEYNGTYEITVTDVDTYTYTVSGTPDSPATGTIKATATLLSDATDGSGEATFNHRYTSDQPMLGIARSATAGTLYSQGNLSATISATGYTGVILLIEDE